MNYSKFDVIRQEDGTFTVTAFVAGREEPLYEIGEVDTIYFCGATIEPNDGMVIDTAGGASFEAKVNQRAMRREEGSRFSITRDRPQPALTVEQI